MNLRKSGLELQSLSRIDKERLAVEQASIDDMLLFPCLPYRFDCPLKKHLEFASHPFAFIDLDCYNRSIAKADLNGINLIIRESRKLSNLIPRRICIPIDEIIFEQKDARYGYTKLICTPYTNNGRLSKYPAKLSFMTDLSKSGNATFGDIFYNSDGKVSKADINIWQNGISYFFKLGSVDEILVVKRITSTVKMNSKGLPEIIYNRFS